MRDTPFLRLIQRGGMALAGLSRSLSKISGISCERILDDLWLEARAILMHKRAENVKEHPPRAP